VTELGSAPVPEPGDGDGDGDGDHRRFGPHSPRTSPSAAGALALVITYADFECPFCAALHERLSRLPVELVFRHFPVRSSHPRAWPAACAAEAAARQGRFWEMHDSLFADQARLEDPHLWARAGSLGLDLDRFDDDRRRDEVRDRVKRDFRSGVRAGVVTTPTLFRWRDGKAERAEPGALERELGAG
jgi:protein-disulfide isomerase